MNNERCKRMLTNVDIKKEEQIVIGDINKINTTKRIPKTFLLKRLINTSV